MPFPVLKEGTAFLLTETGTPVLGFHAVQALPELYEKP